MDFDVLIRNGTIVDGSANARAFRADLGIARGTIAAIGDLAASAAAVELDASGRVVAPGFIDVHVHSEVALLGGPHQFGSVQQGVTTHLTAPDGFGWAPLPEPAARELWESTRFAYGETPFDGPWTTPEAYMRRFDRRTPVNVVAQVPHCAVRLAVMGWAARIATEDELAAMGALTRAWLAAGAVALNLGLDYQPSGFADTRELVALSRIVREAGGLYAAHIRYNDLGVPSAWRETMEIGRLADIPVHISHENVTDVTEPLLEEAATTCDLTFESYLYPAGCTHLALMLPTWAQAGGPAGIQRRLADPGARRRMGEHLERKLDQDLRAGARAVFVANQTGRFIGEYLDEAARAAGASIGEFALQILDEEDPYALMVYHRAGDAAAHEHTIRRTVTHPAMLVASDGIYHGPLGHPRGYGCFSRVLRLCVRELQTVALERAVHKMSGFPAERFRLKGRGLLRPGYGADVVVFDPQSVMDRATWEQPFVPPLGIDCVLVNGEAVVQHGRPTGRLPGRVLRPLG